MDSFAGCSSKPPGKQEQRTGLHKSRDDVMNFDQKSEDGAVGQELKVHFRSHEPESGSEEDELLEYDQECDDKERNSLKIVLIDAIKNVRRAGTANDTD